MSTLTDAINRLPIIRTLHKIYAIYSSNLKLEKQLQAMTYHAALERAADCERSALSRLVSGVTAQKRPQKLLLSLTSYGKRINSVHIAIESLMLQTIQADEIVLWLSEDECSYEDLPEILKIQEKQGLRIAFTKDIGPYTKLIPALREYPEALIVTVDDDFIYPPTHLEKLYKAWCREPEYIHCYRAHRMQYDAQGRLLPYNHWEFETQSQQASPLIFPTACAGVIYFPGCFFEEITRQELFLELCPSADDIWFKVMSLLKGVSCKVLEQSPAHSKIESIAGIEPGCLWDINIENNDKQLLKVIERYRDQLQGILP